MQRTLIYTCLVVPMVFAGCYASDHTSTSATTPSDSGRVRSSAASDVTGEDANASSSTGGIGGKSAEQIDAGHLKDASAGGDSEDKGEKDSGAPSSHMDAALDASVTFFDGDAGPTPPPYCVAPCVWEVIRHCVPTLETCVTNTDADADRVSGTVTCDPNTGWAKFYGSVGLHTFQDSVSRNGITCFSWNHGALQGFPPASFLYDSAGRKVATYTNGAVLCGDLNWSDFLFDGGPHFTDGGVELVDGGVAPAYNMDTSRPECVAWDEATGLPVAPPCSSTRSGTCP